MKYILQIK